MKQFLSRLHRWWSGRSTVGDRLGPPSARLPVLLVVEGKNDAIFLKSISAILSRSDPILPNLQDWEIERRCLFLPTGGDVGSWTMHLTSLCLPQFHLYDRESGSATDARRLHVGLLNLQPTLRACLTHKRALENYLSADAVLDGLGLEIKIDDNSSVADDAAQAILRRASPDRSWEELPPRSRKRRRDRAKRLLNTIAVQHMSPNRLTDRDPKGELTGWLRTIAALSASPLGM